MLKKLLISIFLKSKKKKIYIKKKYYLVKLIYITLKV